MDTNRFAGMLALPLLLAAGPSAWALVPGGSVGRADCLAEWRITTRNVVPTRGTSVLDCQDGDASCDADGEQNGECTFNVAVCGNESDPQRPQCAAPGASTRFRNLSKGLEPPRSESGSGCGRARPFRVALRASRKGRTRSGLMPSRRTRLRMTATAGQLRDVNRLALRCMPAQRVCPAPGTCPPNPAGADAPNEVVLSMIGMGPDLDLGWTGHAHNLLVPGATTLQVCLEDCDALTDPTCATRILTGPGTANGALFGPPLPILAAGVPVCLVREYEAPVFAGGTADLSTGALETTIGLRARMFLTDAGQVCPRCREGRCEGGANDGGACSVDVRLPGPGEDGMYPLSRDCLPSEETLAGTTSLTVPLTTGTSALAPLEGGDDDRPCVAQAGEPAGVPPQASACAATCDATCTGDACAAEPPHAAPEEPICIDAKGGVSQVCCADDTTMPCFATPITRSGSAEPPVPGWPNPLYPKLSRLVAAGTFCEAASGVTTIDAVVGLPGPGAISLPATATWKTPLPCSGDDGETPAPY
jgi:hypothetical protein